MKKLLCVLLAAMMVLSMVVVASAEAEADTLDFHVGIVTGTVSQSEDDRRGAEAFQAKYGEDVVKLATYPDNFPDEKETAQPETVSHSKSAENDHDR